MIHQLEGAKVLVPDDIVDEFKILFKDIHDPENQDKLLRTRIGLFAILEKFKKDPELIAEEQFRYDLVGAMAVRNALQSLNALHND